LSAGGVPSRENSGTCEVAHGFSKSYRPLSISVGRRTRGAKLRSGVRAGLCPLPHNNSADTLEAVVDHYIEFFKRVKALAPPGVVSPVASTDGVNFDRQPKPDEREALLAYLRKL
jgi:hypothetical protein